MGTAREFGRYEEFWPYCVAMHSEAATRWVRLAGTLTGLGVSAYELARGRLRYLAALPLIGYGTAWPARFLLEGDTPAAFGSPSLAGRDAELAETAAKWPSQQGS